MPVTRAPRAAASGAAGRPCPPGPSSFAPVVALAWLAIASLPPLPAWAESSLVVYYMERPPYYVTEDGRPGGLLNDVAGGILAEAGIPSRFEAMPAKRILDEIARSEARVCSVGWFKTAEREAFARFTLPIYRNHPLLPLARSDTAKAMQGRELADILADQGLVLGVQDGFSYGPRLDGLVARSPQVYRFAGSQRQLARMLAAGRIDYMLIAPEEFAHIVVDAEIAPDSVALADVAGTFPGDTRHLMCSRGVPAEEMRRLDEIIARRELVKEE